MREAETVGRAPFEVESDGVLGVDGVSKRVAC